SVAALAGLGPRARPQPVGLPPGEALRLVGIGHLRGGLALARAVRRAWAPAAIVLAVTSRRSRPALVGAAVVPGLVEWARRRPRTVPLVRQRATEPLRLRRHAPGRLPDRRHLPDALGGFTSLPRSTRRRRPDGLRVDLLAVFRRALDQLREDPRGHSPQRRLP